MTETIQNKSSDIWHIPEYFSYNCFLPYYELCSLTGACNPYRDQQISKRLNGINKLKIPIETIIIQRTLPLYQSSFKLQDCILCILVHVFQLSLLMI